MRNLLYGLFILLPFLSCEPVSSPGDPPLRVSVIETSCTEAVLEIQLAGDLSLPRRVTIARNDSVVLNPLVTERPFLALDEGLLPAQTYRYSATVEGFVAAVAASGKTLDTTSHEWVFSDTTIGGSTADFYDVVFLSDQLALVTGGAYDTAGVHKNLWEWDGTGWSARGISYYFRCGGTLLGPVKISRIAAISETEISLFAFGGQATTWNGTTQSPIACLPGEPVVTFWSAWARSASEVYAGGWNGMAVLQGAALRRVDLPLPPGSDNIQGLAGTRDRAHLVAGAVGEGSSALLRLGRSSQWEVAYDGSRNIQTNRPDSLSGYIQDLYIPGNGLMYAKTSSGVYVTVWSTRGAARRLSRTAPGGYEDAIAGSAPNSIFVGGTVLSHFNGNSWRTYPETDAGGGIYYGLAASENTVIAVGLTSRGATILMGRRR